MHDTGEARLAIDRLRAEGNLAEATRLAEQMAKQYPQCQYAHLIKGTLAEGNGHYPEAMQAWRAAEAFLPPNTRSDDLDWHMLFVAYTMRDWEQATLRAAALIQNPTADRDSRRHAHWMQAMIVREQNALQDPKTYQQHLTSYATLLRAHFSEVGAESLRKEWEWAQTDLPQPWPSSHRAPPAVRTVESRVLATFADLFVLAGDPERAAVFLEQASQHTPEDARWHRELVTLWAETGQWEKVGRTAGE